MEAINPYKFLDKLAKITHKSAPSLGKDVANKFIKMIESRK
jgi:hypothetical protein